jgi:hypothetical protein
MNDIIGPFTQYDWNIMSTLTGSLRWYSEQKDIERYGPAIKKERELLRQYKSKYRKAS